jgi:hypothetical protein
MYLSSLIQLYLLICIIIFRTETILILYNTLVLPAFLYGSENWTLTVSQRRRIRAAEMKLLRPLAGHTVNYHKTNDSIRLELQNECILDEMNTEGTGSYTCKECHNTKSLKIILLQSTRKEKSR